MKLQRRLSNHGFPFQLKEEPLQKDVVSVNRTEIPNTKSNYNEVYNYFSEVLFEAFASGAHLMHVDLVLLDKYRDFSNLEKIEKEEFENSYLFFLDDSYGCWEYSVLPKTKKSQERYKIEYLILTVIEDSSDAKFFEAYYETRKSRDGVLFVRIPLFLIKNLHFKEHY